MGGHQLREDWKNSSSNSRIIFLGSQGNSRLPTIRGQSRASFKLSSFSKEAAHLLKGSEDAVRTETLPASSKDGHDATDTVGGGDLSSGVPTEYTLPHAVRD